VRNLLCFRKQHDVLKPADVKDVCSLLNVHTCSWNKQGERLKRRIALADRHLEGILCTNANKS
jgi:hypothetical protein